MSKIYLHIGTHKTGTTSLQQFFSHNEQSLKNQSFLYPSAGRPKKFPHGHHNLVWGIINNNNYDPSAGSWKELLTEIDFFNPKNVIISSENFSWPDCITAEKIFEIKEYLSNHEVKIIIYLRNQSDYLKSHYCQAIKIGYYSGSFQDYLTYQRERLNYYQRLEPWKEAFGIENIIVKIYDNIAINNQLIRDFLETINFPLTEIRINSNITVNKSPNLKAIKIMRLLNIISQKYLKLSQKKCQKLYLKKLSNPNNIISKLVARIPDFIVNEELLSEREKIGLKELKKELKNSNQNIMQEYLGLEEGTLFNS